MKKTKSNAPATMSEAEAIEAITKEQLEQFGNQSNKTESTAGRIITVEPQKMMRLRVIMEVKWPAGGTAELCSSTDPWDADNFYVRQGNAVEKVSVRGSISWFRTIIGNRIVETITWDASAMCDWLSRVQSHIVT